MLRIGPSGNSQIFYDAGNKHTFEAPAFLKSVGLTAFEYSFGRGINLTDPTAAKIGAEVQKYDIALSIHAPYYINFANPDDEMIQKSIGYVINSAVKAKKMNGERVIFHPAAQGKQKREEAFALTKKNVALLVDVIDKMDEIKDIMFCPETMGKLGQIGRVEEVVELCKLSERFVPCFDFGHINSYLQGSLKGKEDYRKIIDYTANEIGKDRAYRMHIHFSKIQYGNSGEIRHLNLDDEVYGPDYAPLAEIIDEYNMSPVIICESRDRMAEDAIIMKNMHKNI